MTDKPSPPAKVGKVLPPLHDHLPVPPAPLGIPLLARMQYRSEEAQVRAYNNLVDAKNGLLRALQQQRELLEAREISLVRFGRLDDLREIERLKIETQLGLLQRDAELENLRKSVEVEELQVRLADAKRRRAEIENPTAPPEPPAKVSIAKKIDAIATQVDEIDEVLQARRAAALKRAGGDENRLTQTDRDELERIETARRVLAEKLYADLL